MVTELIHSSEVRRGDIITGRRQAPQWNGRALVVAARCYDTHLSLDLRWLDDGKLMTGCALPEDEVFTVERGDNDLVIEWARASFASYCTRVGRDDAG